MEDTLLEVRDLQVEFSTKMGIVRVLDKVNLKVDCELSRNLRISVTRNENVPRHFFALARFLSAFWEGVASCQN